MKMEIKHEDGYLIIKVEGLNIKKIMKMERKIENKFVIIRMEE